MFVVVHLVVRIAEVIQVRIHLLEMTAFLCVVRGSSKGVRFLVEAKPY